MQLALLGCLAVQVRHDAYGSQQSATCVAHSSAQDALPDCSNSADCFTDLLKPPCVVRYTFAKGCTSLATGRYSSSAHEPLLADPCPPFLQAMGPVVKPVTNKLPVASS